ncbi:MAG: cation-translocating P-type ATPase [Planctomycetes bacterium]|nr:cation-translocating P-type ATPase [Planctomycetota bacterium]
MGTTSTQSIIDALGSDPRQGLASRTAAERLVRDGRNEFESAPPVPRWIRFIAQFKSVMVTLLVGAALLSGFLGDWIDTIAILAIVLINAASGFFQEERAVHAIHALKQLSAPQAKAKREGRLISIPASEVVVGDVVLMEAGDRVPADARLIDAYTLQTLESSLTGESTPVTKHADAELPDDTPIAERANSLFLRTTVTSGKGTAVVTAVGMNTEIGRIAKLLEETQQESTPLQKRLAQLGQVLVLGCLAIVGVIFVLEWLRGGKLAEVFLTSVSLAVAAIPEGLPAVVTVTLAIGLQRMAKRNAIIRKLPSVETLGCVTVICSDKTGTPTRNEMTVRQLWIPDQSWVVDGEGFGPVGEIRPLEGLSNAELQGSKEFPGPLLRMLSYADQCNNSQWRIDPSDQRIEVVGDPTEIALKVVASKASVSNLWPEESLLYENPFDSDRKRMSQILRDPSEGSLMIVKGAPEAVLAGSSKILIDDQIAPMNDRYFQMISQRNARMASEALRALAIGYRRIEEEGDPCYREEDLVFIGLIGMIDPPRQTVFEAVARCHQAGIRPVMITGDHPQTALAIARTVGIANERDSVLLGAAIETMSDEELIQQVRACPVVARVSAQHKLRVVDAWKRNGHVVAMTGDGVNDAPVVKAADIGIVMGITGTDVAKDAADMILTDDNFASIVNAVEEGRGIYVNIQKFLHFLLACNSSEVLFMFFASILGLPSPLLAIQILWINLVTDGLLALALASEPLGKNLMQRPLRPIGEPILSWRRGREIVVQGVIMASVCLLGFGRIYIQDNTKLEEARAVAFCILTMTQIFYSMACRDFDRVMPALGFFSNQLLVVAAMGSLIIQLVVMLIPWTSNLLGLSAMPWSDLPMVILLSLIPVTLVEIRKLLFTVPR